MKSPAPPFVDGVRELTQSAREALAKEVYDLDTLRGLVIGAAGQGYARVIVRPPRPLDLRGTEAASLAEKHLVDSGFRIYWETYVGEVDGTRFSGAELQVEWTSS